MSNRTTRVVILHGGGVDPAMLVGEVGIKSPATIHSFTDGWDQNEPKLTDEARRADHLLIAKDVYKSGSQDAKNVAGAIKLQSHPHMVRLFDEGGITEIIASPGFMTKEMRIL